jgi:repressor LexA
MALTQRQQQVLDFLRGERDAGHPTPTYREIADRFDFGSPKAATDHVRALERRGYVRRRAGKARGIELPAAAAQLPSSILSVPLLGAVPAGAPSDQGQDRTSSVLIPRQWLGPATPARLFAVQVRGDSMLGRHITDGDVAIAEADGTPAAGDVVVALVDGESTLKTFWRQDGRAVLRAENPQYPDPVPASELMVQGVVRAIFRRLS